MTRSALAPKRGTVGVSTGDGDTGAAHADNAQASIEAAMQDLTRKSLRSRIIEALASQVTCLTRRQPLPIRKYKSFDWKRLRGDGRIDLRATGWFKGAEQIAHSYGLRASAIHSRERAGGSGGRDAAPPCSTKGS